MLTQAHQHGLIVASLIPFTKSVPACHATAIAKCLRNVLPGEACVQHEQDAVEGGFITDDAVTTATLSGCNEWGNEGLEFLP